MKSGGESGSAAAPVSESTGPTFDQLIAGGKEVPSAATATTPNAAPGAMDGVLRQAGLTARNLGPYGLSSAVGAGAGMFLGPGGALAGSVIGPAAFGLADLGSSIYNAVGHGLLGAPRMTGATELVDKLADKIGLPRPETTSEKVVQSVERGVTGAKSIVDAARNAAPLITNPLARSVTTQLAANPTLQYSAAAGGSALPTFAREKFDIGNGKFGPLAEFGLGLGGSLLGGGLAAGLSNVPMSVPVPFGGGRRFDINPGAGNNFANPATADLSNNARTAGVNLSTAELAPDSLSGKMIQGLRRAGNVRDQRAGETASQVANMIENVTENARPGAVPMNASADRAVAVDLRNQYAGARRTAGQLYAAVDTALAAQPGTDRLALANTQTTAAQLLTEFPQWATLTNASTGLRSRLDSIVNGTSNRPSIILGPNGQPMMVPPNSTFADMRTLSKEVGLLLEASRTDPKLAGVHGQLKQLYGSIQNDADTWAATTPNRPAVQAYTAAQGFFRDNVAPFRDNPTLYHVASSRATEAFDKRAENLTQSILSSGNETTGLAARLMSPEGQAAFRFKILENARERGVNPDAATVLSNAGYQRQMGLGRPDTPSAERIIMGTNPAALRGAEQTQAIIDAARGNSSTSKSAPNTGALLLPSANRGIAGGAGYGLAGMMGLDPNLGAALGFMAGPAIASGTERLLSSPRMTRFLLSQPSQPRAGLLAPFINRESTPR